MTKILPVFGRRRQLINAFIMKKLKQKLKELVCLLFGHKWVTTYNPSKEEGKPTQTRVHCKRCGQMYNKPKYY